MPPVPWGSPECGVKSGVAAGRVILESIEKEAAAVGAHFVILGSGQDLCLS